MEDLFSRQETAFYLVARALPNFKRIGSANLTAAKIRSRISTLRGEWAQCIELHSTLLTACPEAQRKNYDYFQSGAFEAHQVHFQNALDHMSECLEALEPVVREQVVSPNRSADASFAPSEHGAFSLHHLPPITLPPFNGNVDEWETFRDRFTALIIENRDLSDFSRMHFLISSLSGRAREALSGIKITSDNFKLAWQTLTSRFEKKRRLIEMHIASLYDLPKLNRESANDLHSLHDKADRAVAALKLLKRSQSDIASDILVYLVSQKLDSTTRRAWKLKISDTDSPPTFDELLKFLSFRAQALEEMHSFDTVTSSRTTRITSASTVTANSLCPLCKQNHFLFRCPKFAAKSTNQRRDLAIKFNRCLNCLSDGHSAQACQSRFNCRTCQKRHHTLIHIDAFPVRQNHLTEPAALASTARSSVVTTDVSAHTSVAHSTVPTPVLLSTARVTVHSESGRSLSVRALLDCGSELTFITEKVAQILRAPRLKTRTSMSGINRAKTGSCHTAAIIHISPRDSTEPKFTTTAYILRALTKYVPRNANSLANWTHLSGLHLADDDPTGKTPIDLIIGADLYDRILIGTRSGKIGQPSAIPSHFGWLLSGLTLHPDNNNQASNFNERHVTQNHSVVALHCSLEHQIQKFWEIEEIAHSTPPSPEETVCEAHFVSTHTRLPNGKYMVRLPFRSPSPIQIGESRLTAIQRLESLCRKLERQPQIKVQYREFLKEYLHLGHMSAVSPALSSGPLPVYIPHHPVLRDASSTTKLRVVFDASSKTNNGTSLNEHMYAGPKLQLDLSVVLLRWRQHKYVYAADITKMYRQILVDPRDRDFQRILWKDTDSIIREYRLNTVTYGTASAPYLALRVIKQLNHDEGSRFPLASPILEKNMYVDDVLFGAEDVPLLLQTRKQLDQLFKSGGFELRKWASNETKLLSDIPADNHGLACDRFLQSDDILKVLGITWNPASDSFQFHVDVPHTIPNTKRSILSTIARLFDPLGWASPVIVKAKIFMQALWRAKLDWDEIISPNLFNPWRELHESFHHLSKFQLHRWTFFNSNVQELEIHGFSDASTVAYAAVVYLRVTSFDGVTTTSLLTSKSKVAPLTPLSVPRLELSAAVLLSRLIKFVVDSLEFVNPPIHCWTDSTVTLFWLTKHPSNWKTFVAHRVTDVQTRLPSAQWHYVPTTDNPADCASRGLLGSEFISHKLWWHGPVWLKFPRSNWPSIQAPAVDSKILESKSTVSLQASVQDEWELVNKFSWWPKLVRVTAYLQRFIKLCRQQVDVVISHSNYPVSITADEFRHSKLFWIKFIQAACFPIELKLLQRQRSLQSKSQLLALSPFLDADGVIRVGGRLKCSSIPYSSKHPILLADHSLTELIIRYTHILTLHSGVQLTLAKLREEFWILRSRNLVKKLIHNCVVCTRERATQVTQLMGHLPAARVTAPSRAFEHCGIDYAGPIATRVSSGRGIKSCKSYIALFICLATRAIHLELVSDYSSLAFLNAYLRFCSRRGLPNTMYSDNGTTFAGADKELRKAYLHALHEPNFQGRTASDGTSWKFIPPHAPHFGGLWEAGVKSVKFHLRRILGSHTLTFEELYTVLCKIEACLNSRPIAPLNDSPDNYDTLTPGHFLIGSAITTIPETSVLQINENRLSRWQLLRHITERFWKVWQSDYLNTLQQKSKWKRTQPSIPLGAIVLIKNPLLPPCKWELGRITHVHAGPDGLVRVVSVRTARSEYTRPISKICLLPINIEAAENRSPKAESDPSEGK